MKVITIIALGVLLSSCEYLALTNPICSKLVDVKGFVGSYNWNIPEAGSIPLKVSRKSKGIYSLHAEGEEMFEYKTCKFGRLVIAESKLDSEDGSEAFYQALELKVARTQVSLRSVQYKEETLKNNGIPYEFGVDDVEGMEIAVMMLDNSSLSGKKLINLRSKTYDRQPFELVLDK